VKEFQENSETLLNAEIAKITERFEKAFREVRAVDIYDTFLVTDNEPTLTRTTR